MSTLPARTSGRFLSTLATAALVVLLGSGIVRAKPDPDQPSPQRAVCALLKGCNLAYETSTCTEALSETPKGMTYDSAWCGWVRGFEKRGIVPEGRIPYEMYRYMGSKYHITYRVADTISIPFAALDHLFQNVPMTAKLINQYRASSYSAEYPKPTDSSTFTASNGSNLTGQAWQVWIRDDHRERIYYGVGRAKILSWALKGNVIIEMKAWPSATDPRRSVYSLRFTMFPVSGLINSIMNMGIFRSVALGKIEDILTDIRLASEAYAAKEAPKAKVVYTPLEAKALERFEALYREGMKP